MARPHISEPFSLLSPIVWLMEGHPATAREWDCHLCGWWRLLDDASRNNLLSIRVSPSGKVLETF